MTEPTPGKGKVLIGNLVDLKKHPYVCPYHLQVPTRYGVAHTARGMLSDGATGVIDLEPEAFFTHDRGYINPIIHNLDGSTRRLNKLQWDLIYSEILWTRKRWLFAYRGIALIALPISWRIWQNYRRREQEDPTWWITEKFVPHQSLWLFPSFRTERAVWIGLPGTA